MRSLSKVVYLMTDTEPVEDWRSRPREANWIYRVRVFNPPGDVWLTRLYVKRSAAEQMRGKYSGRYPVTVEVSAFAPAFVPVEVLDASSTPTRRRLPVVEVVPGRRLGRQTPGGGSKLGSERPPRHPVNFLRIAGIFTLSGKAGPNDA